MWRIRPKPEILKNSSRRGLGNPNRPLSGRGVNFSFEQNYIFRAENLVKFYFETRLYNIDKLLRTYLGPYIHLMPIGQDLILRRRHTIAYAIPILALNEKERKTVTSILNILENRKNLIKPGAVSFRVELLKICTLQVSSEILFCFSKNNLFGTLFKKLN